MTECCSAACNTSASTQSVLSSCARESPPSSPLLFLSPCSIQLPLQSVCPLQIIHMHVTVSGSSQIVPARHGDCAIIDVLSLKFRGQFRDFSFFSLTETVDGPLYLFTVCPFDLIFAQHPFHYYYLSLENSLIKMEKYAYYSCCCIKSASFIT